MDNTRIELLQRMPKNAICAEIGSWKGDFSSEIIRYCSPGKLYLIDPYIYIPQYKYAWYGKKIGNQEAMDELFDFVSLRFSNEIDNNIIEIIRESSNKGLEILPNDHLDWIYIDGNHTYEFVKQDLEQALIKVKPGGFITGDDYDLAGWWNNGVKIAVDEFVLKNSNKIDSIITMGTQFIIKLNN